MQILKESWVKSVDWSFHRSSIQSTWHFVIVAFCQNDTLLAKYLISASFHLLARHCAQKETFCPSGIFQAGILST
jgi:hypothetical protein